MELKQLEYQKWMFVIVGVVFLSALIGVPYLVVSLGIISFYLLSYPLLFSRRKRIEKIAAAFYVGLIYCIAYILLFIGNLFNYSLIDAPHYVTNIFLALFLLMLVKHINKMKDSREQRKMLVVKGKKVVKFLAVLFVVAVILIPFLTLIHELGHAVTGDAYGCANISITLLKYDSFPHTSLICSLDASNFLLKISGIFFPLILVFLLILTGQIYLVNTAMIIFWLSAIISLRDFSELGLTNTMVAFLFITSIFFILSHLLGIIHLYFGKKGKKHKQSFKYKIRHLWYLIKKRGLFMINKEKILSDCRPDSTFWTCNSSVIRNIYELANSVEGLNDWGFTYHVNDQKNDFSKWVREVIEDEVLADRLENERNKEEYVKKIRFRIQEVESM